MVKKNICYIWPIKSDNTFKIKRCIKLFTSNPIFKIKGVKFEDALNAQESDSHYYGTTIEMSNMLASSNTEELETNSETNIPGSKKQQNSIEENFTLKKDQALEKYPSVLAVDSKVNLTQVQNHLLGSNEFNNKKDRNDAPLLANYQVP